MSTMLHAAAISKAFGSTAALRDVDLAIERGEVVALAGENGSGKSTLAKLLAGVIPPDRGRVLVDGRPCPPGDIRQARHHGIAYVPQEPALYPGLSVAENVLMPRISERWFRGITRGDREAARAALHLAGTDVELDSSVAGLGPSVGTAIEIARALVLRPRLMILDEVTTRTPDPEPIYALIRSLVQRGVAVLTITHRFAEIRQVADRVVVLRDGRNAGQLDRAEVTDASITELMVGRGVTMFAPREERSTRGEVIVGVRGLRVGHHGPVDLDVHAGEIVGLGGTVESGRTEVLEAIVGARRMVAGSIVVDGERLRPRNVGASRRAAVGFVPGDRHAQGLILGRSVQWNLNLGSHTALSIPAPRREQENAEVVCRMLSIKTAGPRTPVSNLSGGNAQKVVIGRAWMTTPRLWVLDEPTRGVDVGARAEIYEILRDRTRRGAAVLLASSDVYELVGLCDRVLVMRDGLIAGQLEGHALTEHNVIGLMAGGETGPGGRDGNQSASAS